jgi:hypothetical protein
MFQLGKKTEEEREKKAKEKEARKAEKAEKKEKEKAEKAAAKGGNKDKHGATPSEAGDATSPGMGYDSRMSRDTPSIISTADASEADASEAASPRESLERRVSHTASDAAGSIGKESFMQKLTRKGSTNQFLSFGVGKKVGSGTSFFSSKRSNAGDSVVVPATPDEVEGGETSSSGFFGLGKSTESVGNSPSIGSGYTPKDRMSGSMWGSIKKIGRNKDKTPSLHESIASEATGGEGGEEDEGGDAVALGITEGSRA